MIGVSLLGAAFLSLIWIVLMGFVAGPLLYTTIIVVILGQVGLLVFCSVRLYQSWLSSDPEAHKNIFQLNWTPEIVDDFLKQRYTWLAFTCILGVLLLLSLCLLAFLWERIRIAVALIHEASKAVAQLCPTLFFPFLPFLLQVIYSKLVACKGFSSHITGIKVPKYLEWVFECSKKHSEKKLAQKNTQQIKSTFLSPQIIAQ